MAAAKGRKLISAMAQVKSKDGASFQMYRGDALPDYLSDESAELLDELGFLSDDGDSPEGALPLQGPPAVEVADESMQDRSGKPEKK